MNRYVNIGLAWTLAAFLGAAMDVPAQAQPAAQQSAQAGSTVNLGTVRISRAVKADGKPLPAGTYQIRVTETPASPPAPGQTPQFERWAEFLQGGKVVGREVVTIVPNSEIKQIAKTAPPPSGGSRVELLKGGDFYRVWIHRGGNHYLIHLAV